jgi:hypothetical protein
MPGAGSQRNTWRGRVACALRHADADAFGLRLAVADTDAERDELADGR